MKKAIILLYLIVVALSSWVAYTSYCNLRFDAGNVAGVYISMLSALITFVVAWQIWQALSIKDDIEKIKSEADLLKDGYETQLSNMKSELQKEYENSVSETVELILLRYQDKELQLIANAAHKIHIYSDVDNVQCKLSLTIIRDLLPQVEESDYDNLKESTEPEWIASLIKYIAEKADLNSKEQKELTDLAIKILNR